MPATNNRPTAMRIRSARLYRFRELMREIMAHFVCVPHP